MTRVPVLALSKWAHHSWLPRGVPALTERAQADANARLLARFPQLTAVHAMPPAPRFATLPRPACAKVLRVTAALAHARSLRRVISGAAHETFASLVAPRVLCAIQRDSRGEYEDADLGATLNVFDRADMTAAGLRLALHALGDPALRVLTELRLPCALAQRAAHFRVGGMSAQNACDLLDAAYALAGGEAC
ncbi:hypothetical protein GCT13_07215 [Paraburkholderia sp. CNPSo 3157]|uniref:Uncharacterized protein n=1 Tax=Paraburkholderia franconis TaxID=2654983 RepID=A0A7X1N7D0_9BURK|nr:hypothetical protein [Paraburkholderia franconis]MPW16730.1 hypothetical protein [Paraburkholderia franconis]